ncbi:lysylphosphatidylglycerol synthase transmembrane domain-containing protein [Teredinibacter purpureus]|uniref:lysylphosphatidylglycerol synthase transmembrane domain-containing protein n=1 Tax=Teredinibacter purpureus TaxID=2731756 RepID=UPI0005F7E906|nr:lysylphosphatidylglycerol synthase transmembrane domain-containing protein [Teredinibacter purpureus]
MPKPIATSLKVIFAAAMLVGLGWWVHISYGWASTLSHWQTVSGAALAVGIAMVLVSHLARVWRIHYAYNQQQPTAFKRTLAVSFVHNTVSFLLPMRLGELALPTLSRHQLKIDVKYALATLLLIRLFDAHVLLCLLVFFAGSLWLEDLALVAPITLIVALPIGVKIVQLVGTRFSALSFASPLLQQSSTWITLYVQTLIIWVIKLFALATLAASIGELPINHAWIATIIADASALSPITGFANAGTFELAFTLPLIPLGYAAEPLIKTAVNVHLFIFVINICIGIVGFLLLDSKHSTH